MLALLEMAADWGYELKRWSNDQQLMALSWSADDFICPIVRVIDL